MQPSQSGFKRLAVIGLGLIGGSLALAWRRAGVVQTVVGWDTDEGALAAGLARGIIDEAASSLAAVLADADLVLLAAPPLAIAAMASQVAEGVRRGAIITDVAGTKRQIVAIYEDALGEKAHFVGAHPMAGSEHSGLKAASADLFQDTAYVITPTEKTTPAAVAKMEHLVRAAGARPAVISPGQHDRAVAAISHLPQVTVWALVQAALGSDPESVAKSPAELAGPGWRDTVRLAGSPAALWREVCLANADQIDHYLARLAGEVARLRRFLAAADGQGLEDYFNAGRALAGHQPLNSRPTPAEGVKNDAAI